MASGAGKSDGAAASTDEQRWAAWLARGVEQDRKTRKHAVAVAAIVACSLALWLAVALTLG